VATKSELLGLINNLFSGDTPIALLYFSGHGMVTKSGGYIITPDAKLNDLGVSMDEILQLANASESRNRIIILDCCHAGAFGEPRIPQGVLTHLASGITVLTASRKDESAIEVNGHGVFTNLLIEALKGGASNVHGNITPGGLYAYIDQSLGEWYQRPVFKTNVTRFISLRTVKAQVPKETLRMLIDYFPTEKAEYNLNPSYEFTNSHDIEHKVIDPVAVSENVAIFKNLQKFQSAGLVVPVNAEFMYFAAMNSKSCKLTALGHHYWRLVKEEML
jgi:Caspase domain